MAPGLFLCEASAMKVALDTTALAAGFRGEVVAPNDPGYEQHRRIWNGSIDRRPAVIARCAGVADVTATSSPLARAKPTAAMTSATPAHRAITAGRRSMDPFQIRRCCS